MRIGVLAAQGAFAEHIATLEKLQVAAIPVRLLQELKELDGLIIPGGESTSISHLMLAYNLMSEIRTLARKISDSDGIKPIGVMDLTVKRNAFGRQVDSFETELKIPALGEKPFPGIFIRAPLVEQAGSEVEILARLANGNIVAARQGNLLASAFHPELTNDLRFHQYFLDIVAAHHGSRPSEARFPQREVVLNPQEVTESDIEYVTSRISSFGDDNRAGIERTLHRISAIRNRKGRIVGITCRVGRAIFGTIKIIEDLIESGKSVLLLGRPGVGKTTMLREVARTLADDFNKRVIIVDTSNEIAGDGDIPHPAIGHARRMQVTTPTRQHAVMIEAVENHMPEVIVIDEIGTELEALAARTIAERGVQLVGTAHGNTLDNLMMNPTLADLIGGLTSLAASRQ